MREEVEVLLEMYKVQVARSEHYENLRSAVTNVILSLSAAFVALVVLDSKFSFADAWWGACLIVLGFFGYAANVLHAARSRRHGKRAEAYRTALDALVPGAGINQIRETVPKKVTFLYRVWNVLGLVIASIGALIVALALARP